MCLTRLGDHHVSRQLHDGRGNEPVYVRDVIEKDVEVRRKTAP